MAPHVNPEAASFPASAGAQDYDRTSAEEAEFPEIEALVKERRERALMRRPREPIDQTTAIPHKSRCVPARHLLRQHASQTQGILGRIAPLVVVEVAVDIEAPFGPGGDARGPGLERRVAVGALVRTPRAAQADVGEARGDLERPLLPANSYTQSTASRRAAPSGSRARTRPRRGTRGAVGQIPP